MPHAAKHLLAYGCLGAVILIGAGCTPKRVPPMTVSDLMEDRVTLDGVLLKCNEHPDRARTDTDCLNARVAIERLARDVDPKEEARRNEDFERSREKLRLEQEKARQEAEAKAKVDPYNLPLVPVDAAPDAPGIAQTKP